MLGNITPAIANVCGIQIEYQQTDPVGTAETDPAADYRKVKAELPAAVNLALDALNNSPLCANTLGIGLFFDLPIATPVGIVNFPQVYTAAQVLSSINAATAFGSFNIGPIFPSPNDAPNSITNATTVYDSNRTLTSNSGLWPGTPVVINLNQLSGTSFNGGSTEDQAVTILHELGHAMNLLFTGQADPRISMIGSDASTAQGIGASQDNSRLIRQNCF